MNLAIGLWATWLPGSRAKVLISGQDFQGLDTSPPNPWSRPAPHNYMMAPWPQKNPLHGLASKKKGDTRTCPEGLDGWRLVTGGVTNFQRNVDVMNPSLNSLASRLWIPASVLKHVLLFYCPAGTFSTYLSPHILQPKGFLLCPSQFYILLLIFNCCKMSQIPQTLCLKTTVPFRVYSSKDRKSKVSWLYSLTSPKIVTGQK